MARTIDKNTCFESFHKLTAVELGTLRHFTTNSDQTHDEHKLGLIKACGASASIIILAEQNKAIATTCLNMDEHWNTLLIDASSPKPFQIQLQPQSNVNSFDLLRARYYHQLSLEAARIGNMSFAQACLDKSRSFYTFFAEYQQCNVDILFINRNHAQTFNVESLDELLIMTYSADFETELPSILQRINTLAETYGTPGWFKKAEVEYCLYLYCAHSNQHNRGLTFLRQANISCLVGEMIKQDHRAITYNAHHIEVNAKYNSEGIVTDTHILTNLLTQHDGEASLAELQTAAKNIVANFSTASHTSLATTL